MSRDVAVKDERAVGEKDHLATVAGAFGIRRDGDIASDRDRFRVGKGRVFAAPSAPDTGRATHRLAIIENESAVDDFDRLAEYRDFPSRAVFARGIDLAGDLGRSGRPGIHPHRAARAIGTLRLQGAR